MPDRGYFETRKAIPGYTFILLVLIINYQPLAYVLMGSSEFSSVFGALLAFAALLGGSAIGDLVSQVWWWWFQKRDGQYYNMVKRKVKGKKKRSEAIEALFERYRLTQRENDIQKVLAVLGYVLHNEMSRGEVKEVLRYTTRRWDLFHLHSSIMFILVLGSGFGALIRILSAVLIFKWWFGTDIQMAYLYPEIAVWAIVGAIAIVFFYLLWKGRKWIYFQYDAVSAAIIRNSRIDELALRAIFPDYFEKDTEAM